MCRVQMERLSQPRPASLLPVADSQGRARGRTDFVKVPATTRPERQACRRRTPRRAEERPEQPRGFQTGLARGTCPDQGGPGRIPSACTLRSQTQGAYVGIKQVCNVMIGGSTLSRGSPTEVRRPSGVTMPTPCPSPGSPKGELWKGATFRQYRPPTPQLCYPCVPEIT